MPRQPGRPRLASKELLQEAAFELFQLRGYRATSIEQIAKTAGFSRATFFNFFSSKAELFWLETDALVSSLQEHLERSLAVPAPPTLTDALIDASRSVTSASIPWSLQNIALLAASDDLVSSGASRVLALNRLFEAYVRRRAEATDAARGPKASPSAEAAIHTALLLTALREWIDAGVRRETLTAHLERVFGVPV